GGDLLDLDAGVPAPGQEQLGIVLGVAFEPAEEAARVLDGGCRDPADDPVLDDALPGRLGVPDGVAGAAVQQPVEVAGGPGAQVARLHEQAAEAAHCEVAEQAGPGRPPADDHDVVVRHLPLLPPPPVVGVSNWCVDSVSASKAGEGGPAG